MLKKMLFILMLSLWGVSCVSLPTKTEEVENLLPVITKDFSTITILDYDGVPISNVKVKGEIRKYTGDISVYFVEDFSKDFLKKGHFGDNSLSEEEISELNKIEVIPFEGNTDNLGVLQILNEKVPYGDVVKNKKEIMPGYYTVNLNRNYVYFAGRIEKEGYYIKSKVIFDPSNRKTTLYKPEDYFKISLTGNEKYKNIQLQIKNSLNELKISSHLSESNIPYKSIGIFDFKGLQYVELNVESENIYNSLKMNKYDIGKKLFEEIGVKLMDYLVLINDKAIAGVNLKITGYTKDFMKETNPTKEITYEFIMKKEDIKNYKDKDITSQKLLDNSVILMDNERVELKLQ